MESLGLAFVAIERSAMVSVETESRLAGHAILRKAFRYFGPQGLNLGVSEESERSLRFEDSTGFVSITLELQEKSRRTQVRAVGREYGAQMRAFISAL